MTEKTIDSTQPGADAHIEDLEELTPGTRDAKRLEEVDRDDPPVADLAQELDRETKDAMRLEGDWPGGLAGEGDENHADDAQESEDKLRDNG